MTKRVEEGVDSMKAGREANSPPSPQAVSLRWVVDTRHPHEGHCRACGFSTEVGRRRCGTCAVVPVLWTLLARGACAV